jgi:hypothetical protein
VNGVRDLNQVRTALRGTRMCFPDIIYPGDPIPVRGHYLVKDAAHSGGMGVREWDGKTPPRGREVLESFIEGELASACFVADGRNVRLLGLSRQYAGEPGLGAPAYAWCGNVVPWGGRELEAIVLKVISVLTESFGLTGLNGIDFILQNNIPYLLEVNPRPSASFELFERSLRLNAFRCHSEACQGKLPPVHEWMIQTGALPPGMTCKWVIPVPGPCKTLPIFPIPGSISRLDRRSVRCLPKGRTRLGVGRRSLPGPLPGSRVLDNYLVIIKAGDDHCHLLLFDFCNGS